MSLLCLPSFTYHNAVGIRLCCGMDRRFVCSSYCSAACRCSECSALHVLQPRVIRAVSSLRRREDSATSFCINVFVWTRVISFSLVPRSGSVGPSGKFMSSFLRNCQRRCQSSCIIFIFSSTGSTFATSSALGMVRLFNYHHHSQHIVLFHCGFNFIPLMTNGV